MARNGKISARVAEVLRENAGKPVKLRKLMIETNVNPQAISSAITYLRTKYNAGDPTGLPVTTLTPGKVWAYYPSEKAEGEQVVTPEGVKAGIERMVNKLADAEELVNQVPASEPVVTLRVLGTLKETGEVLVLGTDEWGFGNDVWAMRRLG